MTLKRIPRYCDKCKATTAHEIEGKFRKCLKCGQVIERIATAGDREADGSKAREVKS